MTASARYVLQRLLAYMAARDIPWDGPLRSLCKLGLFSFLIAVHDYAVAAGRTTLPMRGTRCPRMSLLLRVLNPTPFFFLSSSDHWDFGNNGKSIRCS